MQLLPRDEKFYDLFLAQASLVADATALLRRDTSDPSALSRTAETIHGMEERADDVFHEIQKRLNRTFVLPLDPEDVHALATGLDDILDEVERTVNRLILYHIDCLSSTVRDLITKVDDCAQAVRRPFEVLNAHGLDNKEDLRQACVEINRVQQELELAVRAALGALFEGEPDPIAVIKQKEIYERLERVGSCCEHVADVLDTVITKNS